MGPPGFTRADRCPGNADCSAQNWLPECDTDAAGGHVDTHNMVPEYSLDQPASVWNGLLAAYAAAQLRGPDSWCERLYEWEELSPAELSRLHGQLMAQGWIDVEIADRNVGLRYQLTTAGKRALAGTSLSEEIDVAEEAAA